MLSCFLWLMNHCLQLYRFSTDLNNFLLLNLSKDLLHVVRLLANLQQIYAHYSIEIILFLIWYNLRSSLCKFLLWWFQLPFLLNYFSKYPHKWNFIKTVFLFHFLPSRSFLQHKHYFYWTILYRNCFSSFFSCQLLQLMTDISLKITLFLLY